MLRPVEKSVVSNTVYWQTLKDENAGVSRLARSAKGCDSTGANEYASINSGSNSWNEFRSVVVAIMVHLTADSTFFAAKVKCDGESDVTGVQSSVSHFDASHASQGPRDRGIAPTADPSESMREV